MDERRKQIEELEKNKRENTASLDSILERFGEAILGRAGDAEPSDFPAEIGDYRRLRKETAGAEAAIKTVEEQIRRFRELEETIEAKEQEDGKQAKELAGVYARIGKTLFEDAAYRDFAAPFREQADVLVTKVRSLEDRVGELDQKEGNNVFAWIGKSAQGLVLRSFLTKAQDNLDQLYRNAGERFCRGDTPDTEHAGIAVLLAEVERVRGFSRLLSDELIKLREEKRLISESFGAEGNPLKQIQNLKNQISRAGDELKILYRRFGAEAAGVDPAAPADNQAGGKPFLNSLSRPEDAPVLESAGRLNRMIREDDEAIGRLRASLSIDEEAAKIEKFRKLVEEKEARIAELEKNIAEFEDSIRDSEKYIEELRKLL
jgi:hypothetical protein